MCGEWIPLQGSIVRADAFFAVGGFNTLINGPEDIDLLRRLALTERVARTEEIVACISWGREGSTTDWARHSQQSRWAKELILQQAETFQRLRLLAQGPQWHGGLVRIYLASAMWNLQHKRLFSALARGAGARSAERRRRHPVFEGIYRSIFATYQGEAFLAGFVRLLTVRELMPGGGSSSRYVLFNNHSDYRPGYAYESSRSALTQEFRAGEFEVIVVNDSQAVA